jgi:putative membrane protein
MAEPPYSQYERGQLILRDHLAVERTALANERTLLAYLRTAVSVFALGIAFLKIPLFESLLFLVMGWILVPASVVVLLIGVWRYKATNGRIAPVRSEEQRPIR